MNNRIVSAGIVLQSDNKYLIAHPTSKTGTTHGWGVPKGKANPHENIFDTALREFYEESSLNLSQYSEVEIEWLPLVQFEVKLKKKLIKDVYIFHAIDKSNKLIDYPFKCISYVKPGVPELDAYKWVTAKEGLALVTKSQRIIFKILNKINNEKIKT